MDDHSLYKNENILHVNLNELVDFVREKKLTQSQFRTLFILLSKYDGSEGVCHLQKQIMKDSGFVCDTVTKAINGLWDKGIILRVERVRSRHGKPGNINKYFLSDKVLKWVRNERRLA